MKELAVIGFKVSEDDTQVKCIDRLKVCLVLELDKQIVKSSVIILEN